MVIHCVSTTEASIHILSTKFILCSPTTINKLIGSWSARPPPPPALAAAALAAMDEALMEPPCRRSDRVKTTRPTRWAQEPVGRARALQRTERPKPACWHQPTCSTPTPPSTAPPATPHQWDAPLGKQASGPGPYTVAVPPSCSGTRGWPGTIPDKAPMGKCHNNAIQQEVNRTGSPEEEARTPKETTREGLPPTPREDEATNAPRTRGRHIGQRAKGPNTTNIYTNKDQQRASTTQQPQGEAPTERPHQARRAPTRHGCLED